MNRFSKVMIITGLLCGVGFMFNAYSRTKWIPSAAKKDQYTPLMKAVGAGSLTQVQALVASGANVNARTWQYDWQHYVTALDAANYNYGANSNSIEIYYFLISKGAKSARSMPNFYVFKGAVI